MISIVIANYNGEQLLKDYLPHNMALFREAGCEVIVVDDASTDGSVEWVSSHFSDVIVVVNPTNMGFSHSCNAGIFKAKGSIVCLLNSDMKLDQWDVSLVESYFKRSDVFAVTPDILRPGENFRNESLTTGFVKWGWFYSENVDMERLASPVDDGISILWACAGASFYSREKLLELNGLDPVLSPFYVEDLDLSYRAWKCGWKSLYAGKTATFHHLHRGTIGRLFSSWRITAIHLRNKYLFMWKNLRLSRFWLGHVGYVLRKIVRLEIVEWYAMLLALRRWRGMRASRRRYSEGVLSDAEILAQLDV